MAQEMNEKESSSRRDFVNLHQQNRKRRFCDISNSNNLQQNKTENLGLTIERKKVEVKSKNSCTSTEEDIEKMLRGLEQMKSRDEVKSYLKNFVMSYIGILNF